MTDKSDRVGGAVAAGGSRSSLMELARIDPSRGSRYSPNLHAWLSNPRKKHRPGTSRVYRDSDGTLWIGMMDGRDLIGQRLISVLVAGVQADSACWINLKGVTEVENFWGEYERDGRCAIDREHTDHFVGGESRWRVLGNERECLWCGSHRQVLRRWTEMIVREKWESAPREIDSGSSYCI